jgi:hypothetical protein
MTPQDLINDDKGKRISTVLKKYPDAKRIAVENFCWTADPNNKAVCRANLYLDAGLYKWNEHTQHAIEEVLGL